MLSGLYFLGLALWLFSDRLIQNSVHENEFHKKISSAKCCPTELKLNHKILSFIRIDIIFIFWYATYFWKIFYKKIVSILLKNKNTHISTVWRHTWDPDQDAQESSNSGFLMGFESLFPPKCSDLRWSNPKNKIYVEMMNFLHFNTFSFLAKKVGIWRF